MREVVSVKLKLFLNVGLAGVLTILVINSTFASFSRKQRFMSPFAYGSPTHTDLELIDYYNDSASYFDLFYEIKNISSQVSKTKLYCSEIPPNLMGKLKILSPPFEFNPFNAKLHPEVIESDEEGFFSNVKMGGSWTPPHCRARYRILIIIPYKNRLENLRTFLYNMHPFLHRQEIEYSIVIVEQANDSLFNKGILMNAAFKETVKNDTDQYDCVVFHDVDLLPLDDLNLYSCPHKRPRHLSIIVGKVNWLSKNYYILVGGVLIFPLHQYYYVNGYSNIYWGWGAEDDDMYYRLAETGIGVDRPARNTKYKMLSHSGREKNPDRSKLLKKARIRYKTDGLNNVQYTILGKVTYPLFTHLLIDVGDPPVTTTTTTVSTIKASNVPTKKLGRKIKKSTLAPEET